MDSTADKTLWQTDFTLTTDYQDGAWVFKHYRASVSNLTEATATEIEEDEDSPAPPSIVEILGLKRRAAASSISLGIPQN